MPVINQPDSSAIGFYLRVVFLWLMCLIEFKAVKSGKTGAEFRIIRIVEEKPRESLDSLKKRVAELEKLKPTSPIFTIIGWPLLGLGILLWFVLLFLEGQNYLVSILALAMIGGGAAMIVISFLSQHSESVEYKEKQRQIRERSDTARCLYLEGKMPDGRGSVGRCRLYEFDMTDLPYCLYCKEYRPSKGNPEV